MDVLVTKSDLPSISSLRKLFLEETKFQFIYNKCHENSWSDDYLFTIEGTPAGYGCIWGKDTREKRDAIYELYLLPVYRKFSGDILMALQSVSGADFIECKTNDPALSPLLFQYTKNINAEAILFEDKNTTSFEFPGVEIIKLNENRHCVEYELKLDGAVAAEGGMMLNYNFPNADLYYHVKEEFRRKGVATLFIQELKKETYAMGRIPAARCNIHNRISRASLIKAGFDICGYIVVGKFAKTPSPDL